MSNTIEIEYAGMTVPKAVRLGDLDEGATFVFKSGWENLSPYCISPSVFLGFDEKTGEARYTKILESEVCYDDPDTPVIPVKAKLTWSF